MIGILGGGEGTKQALTPRGASLMSHVAELINPVTGGWDTQLIRDTFWDEDAQLIFCGEASAYVSGSCDPDNFVRISGTPRIPASYDPIKLSS